MICLLISGGCAIEQESERMQRGAAEVERVACKPGAFEAGVSQIPPAKKMIFSASPLRSRAFMALVLSPACVYFLAASW